MQLLQRIGRFGAHHPWAAIGAWLGLIAVSLGAGVVVGTEKLPNGAVGESRSGYATIDRAGLWQPAQEAIYLHSATQTTVAPSFQNALDAAVRAAAPLATQPAHGKRLHRLVAAGGHSAIVMFFVRAGVSADDLQRLVGQVQRTAPQLTVGEAGDITLSAEHDHAVNRDLHRAELFSLPLTLVVLIIAFGAVIAAAVPVLLALTAVVLAMGLLAVTSQIWPIDPSTQTVVLLVGMAVGVDYSLFYLARGREEQRRGSRGVAAVDRTAATSGRSVVISGLTVMTAMAGMYLVRSDVFTGIATGTILVVAAGVIGSITVIPAVIVVLGDRIDRLHLRLPYVRRSRQGRPLSEAVVARVVRRPRLALVLALALLLALAVPALQLQISKPSDDALTSQRLPAFSTLAAIRRDFPRAAESATIVVTAPPASRHSASEQVRRLITLAHARGITRGHVSVLANASHTAVRIDMPLTGDGNNEASYRAVHTLRSDLIPATIGHVAGAHADVTGTIAEDIDFSTQMRASTPYVIGFVLALALLVLLVAFRSIVVALKAIVLNLLSVAAAYGILVLVFQHRWAEPILGFRSDGAIIAWLPLFLFVILFGLSMDYHVFILSRIREAVQHGASAEDAVRTGVAATSGVVTSAAAVMVAVFAIFATLSSLDLKQAGVGMAAAVLIDATVVRAVLLPASMTLLGDWNWYLPGWLDWLPRLEIDGAAAELDHRRAGRPVEREWSPETSLPEGAAD
jgi:putative drug exporter of the RND superfamily